MVNYKVLKGLSQIGRRVYAAVWQEEKCKNTYCTGA